MTNKLFGPDMVFYQGQIRKYTSLIGALFSDLYISRSNLSIVKVPIKYGPGLLRNKGGNRLSDDFIRTGLVLPSMAFELVDISPDMQRRIVPYVRQTNSNFSSGNGYTKKSSLSPSPQNFLYSLTIRSKTIEESFQIFEQIIAAFDPQVSIQLIDSKDLDVTRDITVKLEQGYEIDDNYESSQEDVRFVEIRLSFTVKGYIYKRTQEVPVVLEMSVNGQIGDEVFEWATVEATPEDLVEISDLKKLNKVDEVVQSVKKI